MSSEQDEALFWASKALDSHHGTLDTAQAAAGKWQAGIAAFLGAYATVGFVVGPTTLASLPVTGAVRDVILAAMCLAGLIAIVAVWSANRASTPIPKLETTSVLTGLELAQQSIEGTQKVLRLLKRAIVLSAVAGVLAVGASVAVLIAGVVAPTPTQHAILVTSSGAYCGSVITTNGRVSIVLTNGEAMSAKGGTISIVSSCGS
jgi:hypothetical protein